MFSLQTLTKLEAAKTESGVEFLRLTAVNGGAQYFLRKALLTLVFYEG